MCLESSLGWDLQPLRGTTHESLLRPLQNLICVLANPGDAQEPLIARTRVLKTALELVRTIQEKRDDGIKRRLRLFLHLVEVYLLSPTPL